MDRYKTLSANPGPDHALDIMSTREGSVSGDFRFFEHIGPSAACGTRVKVAMNRVFDPDASAACQECPELARDGKAFRPDPYDRPYDCAAAVRLKEHGDLVVHECFLRESHRGPHRTSSGATWFGGAHDFTPAPQGFA